MLYLFLYCVLIIKVFRGVLFRIVHITPSLKCLGSQHPVDPHHSIECINSTKYTVGTVGISDIFLLHARRSPVSPPAPGRFVLVWILSGPPRLDEGSGACLVLPQRATALCQPFPGGEPGSAVRPRRNSVCSSKQLALKTRQWVQTHIEPGPASATARFSLPHGWMVRS